MTQYGKSETVAQAVLTRASTFPEKWAIVSTSQAKAKIIMGFIIDHIFDNDYTKNKFILDKGESEQKIRHEKSKSHVTFQISENRIGEILTISAESKRNSNQLDALMGYGAQNVIVDESSLIDDMQYAGILRMVKGHDDNFILEIGNPFRRNHFYRTTLDPNYEHILIDYKQGLEEGRIKQIDIDEARKAALFDVLYECKFPPAEAVDAKGWSVLMTEDEYRQCVQQVQPFGVPRLGVDVAHGGRNKTCFTLVYENMAVLLEESDTKDLMSIVGKIQIYAEENRVTPQNTFIDATGVGAGVLDRLRELNFPAIGVILGEKASRPERFINRRAECYWRLREWLKSGGTFKRFEDFTDLLFVKYKVSSDKAIKIQPKEELTHEGILSPDRADSLMLTFALPRMLGSLNAKLSKEEEEFFAWRRMKNPSGLQIIRNL